MSEHSGLRNGDNVDTRKPMMETIPPPFQLQRPLHLGYKIHQSMTNQDYMSRCPLISLDGSIFSNQREE